MLHTPVQTSTPIVTREDLCAPTHVITSDTEGDLDPPILRHFDLQTIAKQDGDLEHPISRCFVQQTTASPCLTGSLPATGVGVDQHDDRQTQQVDDVNQVNPVVNNYTNCSFGSGNRSASSMGKRFPKLPVFNDTAIDIEAYLANFNAVTAGWVPSEKLALLREKLVGSAAKVLAQLDLQGSHVTFDTVIDALQQHYVGERSEWMARLRDVRRQEGESLEDLAFRIQLYSQRAYGKVQPDLGLQLYFALRNGPLGDKLFEVKEQPLKEVLQKAKAYETHLRATNQPVFTSHPVAFAEGAQPPQPPHGNTFSNYQGRGRGRGRGGRQGRGGSRYSAQDRRLTSGERQCYICAGDHLWRNCPQVARHIADQLQAGTNVNPAPASNDSSNQ
jgi:hypothetical protein